VPFGPKNERTIWPRQIVSTFLMKINLLYLFSAYEYCKYPMLATRYWANILITSRQLMKMVEVAPQQYTVHSLRVFVFELFVSQSSSLGFCPGLDR
jgi:hypothetical protein